MERSERMAELRRKIKWHVDRAGSGGSWAKAQAYQDELDRLMREEGDGREG